MTIDQLLSALVAACSSCRMAEAFGQPDLLPYEFVSDFVRRLTEVGNEAEVEAVFAIIEQAILTGVEETRDLAVAGFLEDLQNTNLHTHTKPEDFERYLLPASRAYWDRLNKDWAGKPD